MDVETTGWAPEDAAITEIGAVRVHGGTVVAEFGSLVNPVTNFSSTANVIGFAPGTNIDGTQVQLASLFTPNGHRAILDQSPLFIHGHHGSVRHQQVDFIFCLRS